MLRNVPAHRRRGRAWPTCSRSMGARGRPRRRRRARRIVRPADVVPEAPYELVERMRASIVVLGPLLARFGRARVALPGGDDFGPRPIDMHLRGARARSGADVRRSPTATSRPGPTACVGTRHPARVPERRRHRERADGRGAGQGHDGHRQRRPRARDRRPRRLPQPHGRHASSAPAARRSRSRASTSCHPVEHTVIPDRIEAATFLAALGVAGGEITLEGARPDHMDMLMQKLGEMGMRISPTRDGLWAHGAGPAAGRRRLHAAVPGHRHRLQAAARRPCWRWPTASASSPRTSSPGRFRYVDELVRMGADIRTEGHHAVVRGVERLSGAPVRAHDIRAGAALVVAGLGAEGETVVADAHHIDRGYEHFVEKLAGARRRRRAQVAGELRSAAAVGRSGLLGRRRRRRRVGECSLGPAVGPPAAARRTATTGASTMQRSRPSRPGGRAPRPTARPPSQSARREQVRGGAGLWRRRCRLPVASTARESVPRQRDVTDAADAGRRGRSRSIRPTIQADGGDIVLHDVDEDTGVVTVELVGACVSCPASTVDAQGRRRADPEGPGARRHRRSRHVGARAGPSRASRRLALSAGSYDPAVVRCRRCRRRAARRGPRRRPGRPRPPALARRAGRRAGPRGRAARATRVSGHAYTVGLTGAPGAGQVDAHRRRWSACCAPRATTRSAVLAIDPSSPFSGGAILGDRVRMQDHALDPGVFIRSMATRGHLGGLALATPEAIRVLDAVGFTVGARRDRRRRPGRGRDRRARPTRPWWW